MLVIQNAINVELQGVRWVNAPNENIVLKNCTTAWVHDFEIFVDYKG